MGLFSAIMWFASSAWWPTWSNARWAKENKLTVPLRAEHKVKTLAQIKTLAQKMYSSPNYKWTKDGLDQLFDSICPPQYNYQRWCQGKLRDDCDGFAALMLHCLHESGIQASLLSICEKTCGHCVTIFKLSNKWYIIDYNDVYGGYSTAKAAVDAYNKTYIKKYNNGKGSVVFNGIINYNYKKKKYESSTVAKLDSSLPVFWQSLGF